MTNTDIFGVAIAARQKLEGLRRAGVRHHRRQPRRLVETPDARQPTATRTSHPPRAIAVSTLGDPGDQFQQLAMLAREVAACTRLRH